MLHSWNWLAILGTAVGENFVGRAVKTTPLPQKQTQSHECNIDATKFTRRPKKPFFNPFCCKITKQKLICCLEHLQAHILANRIESSGSARH
jgi:hypothetical protein